MPSKTYYLEPNKQKPVTLNWGFNWKNFTVTENGNEIGRLETKRDLEAGGSWNLSDGTTFEARLTTGMSPQLELRANGRPVSGSGADPMTQLKTAFGVLLFLAGLNLLLGIIAEVAQVEVLLSLGMGIGSIVVGLIFGGLAYFVRYKYSKVALGAAIGLIVLDMVMTLFMVVEAGGRPSTGMFLKIIFIIWLARSFKAIDQVKQQDVAFAGGTGDQRSEQAFEREEF